MPGVPAVIPMSDLNSTLSSGFIKNLSSKRMAATYAATSALSSRAGHSGQEYGNHEYNDELHLCLASDTNSLN